MRVLPSSTHKGIWSALYDPKLSFGQIALLCHCILDPSKTA
ncbi:MAG: hypothetical protein AB7E42_08930 [Anaerotignaceae bacterium]